MRNIKLILEYEGTDFAGWQVQPEERTVQGVLSESLTALIQEKVKIIAAGRTDAGVHARGQVVNFATQSRLLLREIHRGLNALLPPDVVVRRVQKVPSNFHARYAAISRRYLYRISTGQTALQRHFVWTVQRPLDLKRMREAAQLLIGTYDFAGFCLGPEERSHCRCTVQDISLKRVKEEIHFHIAANRFLHAMVRIIVGRLVEVGHGRFSRDDFRRLLDGGETQRPTAVAPPQGLCLVEIKYPQRAELGKGE